MKTYEFGVSLERVSGEPLSKLTPRYAFTTFFLKKICVQPRQNRKNLNEKSCERIFFLSLERVWREFSKLSPNSLFPNWLFQTHKEKSHLFVISWHQKKISIEKSLEKMSLENLQTLSKLKKNMRSQLFLKKICIQPLKKKSKKVVNTYFLWVWREFGESLGILQTHFFPICSKKKKAHLKKKIKQRFLCEFGVSLEILQARSKLICFHWFLLFHCFFGKEEWVWSEFGDSSNSPQTRSKLICSFFSSFVGGREEWVWSEFGVLQTHFKLAPNSNDFIS